MSAGQAKFAGQRLTFYDYATQPQQTSPDEFVTKSMCINLKLFPKSFTTNALTAVFPGNHAKNKQTNYTRPKTSGFYPPKSTVKIGLIPPPYLKLHFPPLPSVAIKNI